MAARYWIGGNATWDSTAGSKWALTSGGAGGQAVPTASDDVFLDNGTGHGNVTIATGYTALCKSLTCTGYVGTLSSASSTGNLTVSGNITLVSGMTLSVTGLLTINATSTVVSAGKTWGGGITVSGSAITVTLGDSLACSGTLTLTQGTLDCSASNYNISCAAFSSSNTNSRTLTLRAGVMTITGTGTAWDTTTVTSFSWGTNSAGSAVVFNYSGSSAMTINSGAFTIPTNVDFKWTNGTYNLTKPTNFDTAHLIDFTGYAGALQTALSTKAATLTLSSGLTLASGNALTLNGSGGCTLTCAGKTITTFTISSLSGTLTFADTPGFTGSVNKSIAMVLATGVSATFSDLTCTSLNFGTGGSLTLTGSGTIYSGNMSGTGTLTSNYSGSSARTISTAGASSVDLYLQSGSGTITLGNGSSNLTCGKFYSTGFTGTFYINLNNIIVAGSVVDFTGGATYSTGGNGETVTLSNATITSLSAPVGAAKWLWGTLACGGNTPSVTLGGNVDIGIQALSFTDSAHNATLDMNGYNFKGSLSFAYTGSLSLGSGSHTLYAAPSTGYALLMTYGGSITGGTSTVTFDGTGANGTVYFVIQNASNNLYNVTGSFNNLVFKGPVVFKVGAITANNLSVTLSTTNQFTHTLYASTYWSITNAAYQPTFTLTSLTLAGDATHTYTLTGNTYGYGHSKFVISSGVITCDYLSLVGYDASGGATFYYGANSTLSGSPVGWAGATPSKITFLGRPGPF